MNVDEAVFMLGDKWRDSQRQITIARGAGLFNFLVILLELQT